MSDLVIRATEMDPAVLLHVEGEVDATSAGQLEHAIEAASQTPKRVVIVDLKGVGYIASAGWGVLLAGSRIFERSGKQLVLAAMSMELRRVFDMLHFNTVLRSTPDVEGALRLAGAA